MKSNFLLCFAIIFISRKSLNHESLFSKRIAFKLIPNPLLEAQKLVKTIPDRELTTVLNSVSTSKQALNEISQPNAVPNHTDLINSSPEAERFDIRTQLMSDKLQFTDDIRLIIANVLDMRRSFNETKKMQALMNIKSLYRGAGYQAYSADIRLNRPLQMLLENGEIQPPPRMLADVSFPISVGLPPNGNFESFGGLGGGVEGMGEGGLGLAREVMSEREIRESGIEEVVKALDYRSMYELGESDFENFNVGRRKSQNVIL